MQNVVHEFSQAVQVAGSSAVFTTDALKELNVEKCSNTLTVKMTHYFIHTYIYMFHLI